MPSERTEEATPRKLRQARQRGQVPRSRDLSAVLVLLAGGGALLWAGGALFDRLRWLTATVFRQAVSPDPPPPGLVLDVAFDTVTSCLWPVLGAATLTAAAAGLVQVRPLLTFEPLKPRLARLDPRTGLKRMGDGRGLFEAFTAAAKVLLVGAVLALTLGSELRTLVGLVRAGPAAGLSALGAVIGDLLLRGALALGGLAVIDLVYQRYRYRKDLRMTRQEVIQEQRETEGDLSRKGERRRLHAELLRETRPERRGRRRP